jgi:cellulose biosynthesis protein BcsQ
MVFASTRSFVFTNHKGGVGKSTSATNIALGMVQVLRRANAANCRVLIIDTDSQAHASLVTTGRKDYGADDSLYSVLLADRQNAAQTRLNRLHPASAGGREGRQRLADKERHRRSGTGNAQ